MQFFNSRFKPLFELRSNRARERSTLSQRLRDIHAQDLIEGYIDLDRQLNRKDNCL